MAVYIALLHSIGLGAGRRLVMADLRRLAADLGLENPRTLIATGNLVFEAAGASRARLEAMLEVAFEKTFGRHVDIVIRVAPHWRRIMAGNPFPGESARAPSRVVARIARVPLAEDVAASLAGRGVHGERVKIVNGHLWIHFPQDPGQSRLFGALTTKRLGVGTIRNWNTLRRLSEMASL